MTAQPGFLDSEFPPASPEKAKFYIIPCPLERSVSYGKGTAAGPAAILAASRQLEKLESGKMPGKYGIYTMPPINCAGPAETVLCRIEAVVEKALEHGALPILLGGEHTVALGAIRAFQHQSALTGEKFGIVQFDAHADMRAQYEGDPYSHATVMHHALGLDLPIVQFAVREISPEEVEVRKYYGVTHYDAYFLARVGLPEQPLPENFPQNIYISFDVDALDPSLMPATGTPSPGGLNWRETQFILEACARGHKLIGADIVELAPIPGLHHADFTAAKLAHLLMTLDIETESTGSE